VQDSNALCMIFLAGSGCGRFAVVYPPDPQAETF
jgi:hypothetical protein